MSNIDKMTVNEQLFTELTPEEGAVVAGGILLYIEGIQALKAGADTADADDTYITLDGKKIWGDKNFSTGKYRPVEIAKPFKGGKATIRLFDDDAWLSGPDDYLGGFTVSSQSTRGRQSKIVSGGGSKYEVFYEVLG